MKTTTKAIRGTVLAGTLLLLLHSIIRAWTGFEQQFGTSPAALLPHWLSFPSSQQIDLSGYELAIYTSQSPAFLNSSQLLYSSGDLAAHSRYLHLAVSAPANHSGIDTYLHLIAQQVASPDSRTHLGSAQITARDKHNHVTTKRAVVWEIAFERPLHLAQFPPAHENPLIAHSPHIWAPRSISRVVSVRVSGVPRAWKSLVTRAASQGGTIGAVAARVSAQHAPYAIATIALALAAYIVFGTLAVVLDVCGPCESSAFAGAMCACALCAFFDRTPTGIASVDGALLVVRGAWVFAEAVRVCVVVSAARRVRSITACEVGACMSVAAVLSVAAYRRAIVGEAGCYVETLVLAYIAVVVRVVDGGRCAWIASFMASAQFGSNVLVAAVDPGAYLGIQCANIAVIGVTACTCLVARDGDCSSECEEWKCEMKAH